MKYKVLKQTRIGGKFVKAGDEIEYSGRDQVYLICGKIIEPIVEPVKAKAIEPKAEAPIEPEGSIELETPEDVLDLEFPEGGEALEPSIELDLDPVIEKPKHKPKKK